MDQRATAKLIQDIVGPIVGDLVKELRREIKQLRNRSDLDCEELALKIEPVIHNYLALRLQDYDERLKALEQRFTSPRRVA